MRRLLRNHISGLAAIALAGCITSASTEGEPAPMIGSDSIKITSPRDDARVSGNRIEVTGTGADPAGLIELSVYTDNWYRQDGTATINPDGSWAYSPCYLSGQGRFNRHSIRVTVIKDGKRGASATVTGVVRQD